jgi:hypothetical protein
MDRRCAALLAFSFATIGCRSGGVGDPCVPEDEYQAYFSGYELGEVNLETRSFQCETRVCLVNHFQGRVSCPYGQSLSSGGAARCHIPGSSQADGAIHVDVRPQFVNRRATDAVYCSCRCGGSDARRRYCTCPEGFACVELLPDIGVGPSELTGSYCVKAGTAYDQRSFLPQGSCDIAKHDCGNEDGS